MIKCDQKSIANSSGLKDTVNTTFPLVNSKIPGVHWHKNIYSHKRWSYGIASPVPVELECDCTLNKPQTQHVKAMREGSSGLCTLEFLQSWVSPSLLPHKEVQELRITQELGYNWQPKPTGKCHLNLGKIFLCVTCLILATKSALYKEKITIQCGITLFKPKLRKHFWKVK